MPFSQLKILNSLIAFGSKDQRQKLSCNFPVNILDNLLHPVDTVRNLGVWFDAGVNLFPRLIKTAWSLPDKTASYA